MKIEELSNLGLLEETLRKYYYHCVTGSDDTNFMDLKEAVLKRMETKKN